MNRKNQLLKTNVYILFCILILLALFALYAEKKSSIPFKNACSWLYQLQSINFNKIKDSYYDILVTDYSWDGSEEKEYRQGQIPRLKKMTGKIVLAYISIGEAEDYRFYWKNNWKVGNPGFLMQENPNWKGCFKVKYWNKKWQQIIFQYIDHIIDMGFDGLYIDLVDSYQYFKEKNNARELMIQFIINIAQYCRKERKKNKFLIVPQNAPELVEDSRYMRVISGIGQEETYFKATDIPSEDTEYNEKYLDMVKNKGKVVLTVDYCSLPENIEYVYKKASKKGYIPYCTVVDLDQLIDNALFYKKYFTK